MELSEIKAIIKKDPETKDLELNDQDLLTAYQYLLLRDGNSLKGFRPILVTKPFLHINYAPTKEKREEELTVQLRQNLETFESDIYIKDASLDDFIVSDEFHEKAMAYVKEYLRDPKKTKGMYLYGPYGSGKSYFFSGLAKELTKRHIDVVYVFLPDLIRSIKQSIGSPELEKKINILKRCDVLILDDLGGENMSM
ncbi:MAG TPA: ATP-binding protein, partial [Acholeplasma sp.]|nr:ATP-binding protein [Acholeplasma sp.]